MAFNSSTGSALGNQELSDLLVKAALSDPRVSAPGFDSSRVFALASVLLASPSAQQTKKQLLKSMKTVYLFHITQEAKGEERSWFVDMKKKGRVGLLEGKEKAPLKPDVTVWIGDRDFVGLATGKLNPQKLYAAKRIRVRGNLDKALEVEKILSQERQKLEGLAPRSKEDGEKKEKGRWLEVKEKVKAKL
ncbi:SCP2 sterol-binding domain-containing protein [Leucosporidium creatinivorum]|uniref:SCP2 sterol-binding domain-containing protein n=1 Tax=Leucosporidium creatinivorum TaxID=106004 RepID=A0A1Y2EQ02_9BASI|nr:SCP2 sterol-binding domain-containing protein [Leucosporidium creatinivorum]